MPCCSPPRSAGSSREVREPVVRGGFLEPLRYCNDRRASTPEPLGNFQISCTSIMARPLHVRGGCRGGQIPRERGIGQSRDIIRQKDLPPLSFPFLCLAGD